MRTVCRFAAAAALLLAPVPVRADDGPIVAIERTLARIHAEMVAAGIDEPLRFSAALSDGQRLHVFRWSSDEQAPSVYFRQRQQALVVVSEPIDDDSCDAWQAVPPGHVLEARCGEIAPDVRLHRMDALGTGIGLQRAQAHHEPA